MTNPKELYTKATPILTAIMAQAPGWHNVDPIDREALTLIMQAETEGPALTAIVAHRLATEQTLETRLAETQDENAKLKARLEVVDGWSEDADGISCRGDTIKLLDERLAETQAALEAERAKVARLREALDPFARAAKWWNAFNGFQRITALHEYGDCLEVRHLRAADAVLKDTAP